MTVTIDATVKGLSANSYVTLAEAEAYFAARPNSTDWTGTDDVKNIALAAAARILDTRVIFPGNKTTTDQTMMWPRTSVRDRHGWSSVWVYLNPDTIPQFLKDAQCEQALFLMGSVNPYLESDKRGIKELTVESIRLVFDKLEPDLTICRPARELMAEYGEFPGNRPTVMTLVRT